MWFTAYAGQIGRILTKYPNTVTLFTIPDGGDGQQIVSGPDGALWFTEYNASRIGRIWPFPPYRIEQFPVPTTVAPISERQVGRLESPLAPTATSGSSSRQAVRLVELISIASISSPNFPLPPQQMGKFKPPTEAWRRCMVS
jgi:streptogramin lyase